MHAYHLGTAIRDFDKSSRLSAHQKSVLESSFAFNRYPNATTITELAQQTKLGEATVYNWFCKKRRKTRLGEGERTLSSCQYMC